MTSNFNILYLVAPSSFADYATDVFIKPGFPHTKHPGCEAKPVFNCMSSGICALLLTRLQIRCGFHRISDLALLLHLLLLWLQLRICCACLLLFSPRIYAMNGPVFEPMEDEPRKIDQTQEVQALRRVINAYMNYKSAAEEDVGRWERSFCKLSPLHKAILPHIPAKHQELRRCIAGNSSFISAMLQAFDPPFDMSEEGAQASPAEMDFMFDDTRPLQVRGGEYGDWADLGSTGLRRGDGDNDHATQAGRDARGGWNGSSSQRDVSQRQTTASGHGEGLAIDRPMATEQAMRNGNEDTSHSHMSSGVTDVSSNIDLFLSSRSGVFDSAASGAHGRNLRTEADNEALKMFLESDDSMVDGAAKQAPPKPALMTNHCDDAHVPSVDVEKVRCIIRNIVRDWAEEGSAERDECYKPILKELESWFPDRKDMQPRCLVPGAGLARLACEISRLGFESQGNEFSYYMLICSSFILNHTQEPLEWEFYPWIHSNCNMITDADQLLAVRFPDLHPGSAGISDGFSMCAGDFVDVYSHPSQASSWDAVVTCFFIDTAHNIVEYVEVISKILKTGGVWINLGPLLYHFAEAQPYFPDDEEMSLELCLEDVKKVALFYGLHLEKQSTVETSYTANRKAMMQTRYSTAFWTMTKLGSPDV